MLRSTSRDETRRRGATRSSSRTRARFARQFAGGARDAVAVADADADRRRLRREDVASAEAPARTDGDPVRFALIDRRERGHALGRDRPLDERHRIVVALARVRALEEDVDLTSAAERRLRALRVARVVTDDDGAVARAPPARSHEILLETATAHAPRDATLGGRDEARARPPIRRAADVHHRRDDERRPRGTELRCRAEDGARLVHGQAPPDAAHVLNAATNVA